MKKTERRDKTTIITNLLEVITSGGVIKTHLMYGANMSYSGLERYINAFMESGWITENSGIYKTTSKGIEALKKLRESSELLKEFNKHW